MNMTATNHSPHADSSPMSRYTDLTEEPVQKMLTPIAGYENCPVLSLEEAVVDVSNCFINLKNYIWIAKNNCQNPDGGLSQDESAAIHLYTMQFANGDSLYQSLNRLLRTENRDALIPWHKYLKLFLTALFKINPVSTMVWRGIRGKNVSHKYPTGRKFAWWGVSSCTMTPDVLQKAQFLGNDGDRTLFSIECINGKPIKNHSYFNESEKEIILLPGTFFEVVGQVNPAEGLHIIHLKEIEPPFSLLNPPFVDKTKSFDLNVLKSATRSCEIAQYSDATLAGSDQHLLCSSANQITLLDKNGCVLFALQHDFVVSDICWLSQRKQFLLLSTTGTVHSLDTDTHGLQTIVQLNRSRPKSCTAYGNKLMISNYDEKSFIDVYDLRKKCQLIQSYELPPVGKRNQYIELIRLNETFLGIMLNQFEIRRNWFELRQPDDMSVLHSIDLIYHDNIHRIIALPNNEYLIHAYDDDQLTLLTDRISHRSVIKPNLADSKLSSIGFISDQRCLAVNTIKPLTLYFYDL